MDSHKPSNLVNLNTTNQVIGPVWSSGYDASLMRQTRVQYPGATLGGQAGHFPTPAVKGMSSPGAVREKYPNHPQAITIFYGFSVNRPQVVPSGNWT